MPELPEVETVVRTLRPLIVGKTLGVPWTSGLPLRLARKLDEKRLRALTTDARVRAVRRRGKYILIDLASGAGLMVHLGMTGRLRVQDASEARAKHTHVIWSLSGKRELRFIDPRRFGSVEAAQDIDALPEVAALGPDPLSELDARKLGELLAGSRAPIKAFLLDQHRIAGLGNIYVCEALNRARLSPRRKASTLNGRGAAKKRADTLANAIKAVLTDAIEAGGSSLRDHRRPDGELGLFQHRFRVYDRAGERCPNRGCAGTIRRIVQNARSTFFCPVCQR